MHTIKGKRFNSIDIQSLIPLTIIFTFSSTYNLLSFLFIFFSMLENLFLLCAFQRKEKSKKKHSTFQHTVSSL